MWSLGKNWRERIVLNHLELGTCINDYSELYENLVRMFWEHSKKIIQSNPKSTKRVLQNNFLITSDSFMWETDYNVKSLFSENLQAS